MTPCQLVRNQNPLSPVAGIRTEVSCYALAEANTALAELRQGRFSGAAVLLPGAQGA